MFSTLSCLKDRAERLQQFHRKKASPQSETVSQPLPRDCPQKQRHLLETFSLHKETAGPSFRVHTDQDGTPRSITVKGKEMRRVRKGRGKERTYISGEKERGGQSLPISLTLHLGCRFLTLQEFSGSKRGTRYQGSLKTKPKSFLNM